MHAASKEQLSKYNRIKRRLQDLRRRRCAHCRRHFRIVSLRAHEKICARSDSKRSRNVEFQPETCNFETEVEESCDEEAGVEVSKSAVCEQVLALHNVRLKETENDVFSVECEFCGSVVSMQNILEHLNQLHANSNKTSFEQRIKRVQKRLQTRVERTRKLHCRYCFSKFMTSQRKLLCRHEDRCLLNPDREKNDDDVMKEEDTCRWLSGCWSCSICGVKVTTATSLMHHVTNHHRHHASYQRLWDEANRARLSKLQVLAGARRKESDLRCVTCRFRTTHVEEMRAHKIVCKAQARQFVCHLCGKTMNLCNFDIFYLLT